MTDLPILFSGPMVRALLAGTKTQTRRAIKLPDWATSLDYDAFHGWRFNSVDHFESFSPRINEGDRLYVREHWRTESRAYDDLAPSDMDADYPVIYAADADWSMNKSVGRFRQGMHMPRWASRITLHVTDVRVQRLQDISEEDALAEGIEDVTREVAPRDPSLRFWRRYRDGGWNGYVDTPVGSYASLWTEINDPGSWEANPWVAATTFEVERCNIAQARAA